MLPSIAEERFRYFLTNTRTKLALLYGPIEIM